MNPVDIAQALVRIPSVNPDGDPGTPHTGEQACAEWIADFLRSFGAETELREVLPSRPNVVSRLPSGSPGKPRILFAPHTDTVSVAGMTIAPFGGEIRDGRLLGRGATDTKGPAAAMLHALRAAAPWIHELPYEIWFAGLVGEEAGQHGAKALAEQEFFDFVIAGEPTELQTVHAHKGSCWTWITTHGKAVHASKPGEGINAIYRMVVILDAIRTEIEPALASLHDPILGHPTISVGTIRGGSKVNIVPDACEIGIDMRTIPGQDAKLLDEAVLRRIPDAVITRRASEPLFTDPGHPLVQRLAGLGAKPVGAPWFCDAAVFAAKGSAAIALGPGSIAQAHTCDEFIEIADLDRGAAFFLSFLEALRVS